jgi:hypothetical protein
MVSPAAQANQPAPSSKPTTQPKKLYKLVPRVSQQMNGNNGAQVGGSINTGPCSTVQVAGSNNKSTINCTVPTIAEITVVVGYECQVEAGKKIPTSALYNVASTAGVLLRGTNIALVPQPRVDVIQDPSKPLTAFVTERFTMPGGSLQGQPITLLYEVKEIDVNMLWPGDTPKDDWCVGANGAVYLIAVNGKEIIPQTKAERVSLPKNGYAEFQSGVSLKGKLDVLMSQQQNQQ